MITRDDAIKSAIGALREKTNWKFEPSTAKAYDDRPGHWTVYFKFLDDPGGLRYVDVEKQNGAATVRHVG